MDELGEVGEFGLNHIPAKNAACESGPEGSNPSLSARQHRAQCARCCYLKGCAVQYWIETLGCPKNHVDSDKLAGLLESQGYVVASSPREADLVVANTCAFIEAAREESIETVLELADVKRRARDSSSRVAWPSATAKNSRPRCPKSTSSQALEPA